MELCMDSWNDLGLIVVKVSVFVDVVITGVVVSRTVRVSITSDFTSFFPFGVCVAIF